MSNPGNQNDKDRVQGQENRNQQGRGQNEVKGQKGQAQQDPTKGQEQQKQGYPKQDPQGKQGQQGSMKANRGIENKDKSDR